MNRDWKLAQSKFTPGVFGITTAPMMARGHDRVITTTPVFIERVAVRVNARDGIPIVDTRWWFNP